VQQAELEEAECRLEDEKEKLHTSTVEFEMQRKLFTVSMTESG